jgi:two-component system, OmpR family, phosphate regulon sensor histidine kinase PhoR
MPPARVGGLWQAARHGLVTHTFAPPWLTGRWAHPAVGYLVAVLLQVSAVTGLTALTWLFPSFQFQEALVILVILLVALTWGVGPSLLATVVGGALLALLLLPPAFSLVIARIEDALNLLVYLCVGCAVSLLTSQAQRARRAAERLRRRLDTIIEAIPDGLSIHDAAGRMVRLNPVAQQLFGVPAPEASGSSGGPFPTGGLAVASALRGEMVTAVETRVWGPEGREHCLVTNAAPFHNAEGRIEGVVLIWHDVSALRQAEQAATARAGQLEAIQQAMTDTVMVFDSQGHLVLWNAAAEQLLPFQQGDTTSHPVPEHVEQLLPQDEQGQPFQADQWPVQRILNGEMLTGGHAVDMLVRRADDRELLMNFNGAPIRDADGRISSGVLIGRDVTERRRLEASERRLHAETQARQALLQLILDAMPSSVHLVRGRDAQLVLANRAAAQVWGVSWQPGQPMGEFLAANGIRILDGDGHPLAPEQLATVRALQKGETVQGYQEMILHADGTALPVLVNAVALGVQHLTVSPPHETPYADEASEPAAIVVHQDVTALKEAETLKDEFIGLVAHELRHPVAVLGGFAQTLLEDERGGDVRLTNWQREALQGIDQATFHLVRLTDELLDATRLQAGRLELAREPTDLVALCRRVVARFQRTAPQRTLSLETPLDHLVAQVDPERIEQVVDNLLSNAIKYSPANGPVQVALHESNEATMAFLSVADRGIGIPAQQQARIFGRFERADNSRVYGIGGTGLGLYLSRALVEEHGGRIWFESVEGQGSTFFIVLPLASESSSVPQQ